jgi:hypothetical protein
MEEGLGAIEAIDGSEPTLLILDDLMQEAGKDKKFQIYLSIFARCLGCYD